MKSRVKCSLYGLILLLFCCSMLPVAAQTRDTILNMVLSKPYIYNLIKSGDKKIYLGTAEGIFEVQGTQLRQYGINPGYVKVDAQGKPQIDPNGVRYYSEKKYGHLLPFPAYGGYEYHASLGNQFYLTTGGRLYIYDILSYGYSYPNHSIRSISRDFVGTYSGIYFKGKRLDKPVQPFTDGYIRQLGDRAFICSYDLMLLESEALESGSIRLGENALFYGKHDDTYFINDVCPTDDSSGYYVATQDKLIQTNLSFSRDSVLFTYSGKNGPVGIHHCRNSYGLVYYADKELYKLRTGLLVRLDTTILSVLNIVHQLYLVTHNGLYRFNSNQKLEKLVSLSKAHTLASISDSELIIATDLGLYHYNLASGELSVIVKSVEFNRKALFVDQGIIQAGSVNGLYSIRISAIPQLIEEHKYGEKDRYISNTQLVGLTLVTLIIVSLLVWLIRLKRKLNTSREVIQQLHAQNETVTKEKVEQFILDNLEIASIKSITDHFKLNTQQLYELVKPEKPGSIIQKYRIEKVRKMREEQKNIKDISAATGLSVSYLRQLKTD